MAVGIICEFNPFHAGHKYLIDTVKKETDCVICVMSGNLVQRGEFAVYDRFTRAAAALNNGADVIIDLPCAYSVMPATDFAKYSVQLLEACGAVSSIAFGAECPDMQLLQSTARDIDEKGDEISAEIKKGVSYPAAVRAATGSEVLDFPNNTLAVEYIRHTSLPCTAVKRITSKDGDENELYSAHAVRAALDRSEICSLKNCESAVLAKLRTMSTQDFLQIDGVSEGLENRICAAVAAASSLDALYADIKTKRYTLSRIRRIILKSYLSITKEYTRDVPYIRILGFSESGRKILPEIKKRAQLPVITRYGDVSSLNERGRKLFELECHCTDLYNLGFIPPRPCGTEQTAKLITPRNTR